MEQSLTTEARSRRHRTAGLLVALFVGLFGLIAILTIKAGGGILAPAGPVARDERSLIFLGSLLSLTIILPVFALTFWIAWKYRAGNRHVRYQPEWDHSRTIETIWWLLPLALITMLAVVTWRSTHALDPNLALASNEPVLHVQVVALQWRWLFLYPDQHVASLNHLVIPVNRPVQFEITADAPMNSFWIPKLGGQIYAMPGMSTSLNLMADRAGTYRGSSANLSGQGFASMNFAVTADSRHEFNDWVSTAKVASPLDTAAYDSLAKPSSDATARDYDLHAADLYDHVIHKYMSGHDMEGM